MWESEVGWIGWEYSTIVGFGVSDAGAFSSVIWELDK